MMFVFLFYTWIFFYSSSATNCPDLWTSYHDSCYLFGHQHLTFVEAEHYCKQHNGRLVYLETSEENAFVEDHISFMTENRWWIGLSDDDIEGHWVWYGTDTPPEYTDWSPGQPDDAQDEDCGEIYHFPAGWHWNDADCNIRSTPICEKPGGQIDNGIIG